MTVSLSRLRGSGKRRAADALADLRDENRRLRRASDDLACALNTAKAAIVALQAERNGLAERLDTEAIDTAELHQLRAENGQLRAQLARLTAVDVPPMVRDVEPGIDDATWPHGLDCRSLQQRFAAGPVIHLSRSPGSTDPRHIPSWAQPDGDAA
ncbi:hypothetical protein CD790_25860 [Streptomyces sp. SAJ15]|nr:hypothetical protein CD790_25860 [Streptomyces sp. SAJ15]